MELSLFQKKLENIEYSDIKKLVDDNLEKKKKN